MSMASGYRKKGSAAAAMVAPARGLGRGGGSAAAFSLSHGGGSAAPARSLGRGGGSAAASTHPTTSGFHRSPASLDGFLFPPSQYDGSYEGGFPSSSAWFDAASGDASSPGSWDKDVRPSGCFMSYFTNQPHNSHLVGAMKSPLLTNNVGNSPQEVENSGGNENDNVRTEKRIMWTEEEDIRLMSAWIEHSTDSTCGADKPGGQYWGEVVEAYNKNTPPLRRRNLKQSKDRWHKINRWTDLFECAYIKARRIFTSGYSDQMWIDAAHKFYAEDNKDAKLGPFVLMEVWKICQEVSKWKTYNEGLRNARKRKSFHLEGDSEENDDTFDEMPKRPMGQKAAKRAALAANGKSKGSNSSNDGQSKESPIDRDKFDRYSKFQEENNEKRMKLLDRQEKLSSEKLEATKIAHQTAQDYKEGKKLEKESKMMETYNNLLSQDTSAMSAQEKAQRVSMMKCLMKALFPESD
ncbi:unnamed protein product [Urochloa decumbens]|uniref:Myb-like domain-containing protein n=1 Tax=Urochloa decumbens TaxID=240449 RepID=A0ABC9AUH6_9POAL